MPQAALPYIAVAAAVGSLGYGIYAGQQAQAAQAKAIGQAKQQADQARADQQSQYQQQLQQEQQTTAQNLAQEAQTKADTQAAQQQALAAEQAAIGTNSTTLSNSLNAQNLQETKDQQPILEGRLNQLGLLNSGALPAQQAKYQADLQSQAQAALANYQIGAQGQLTQDTNAASANQVNLAEQNALLNIQNGEQNMAQNFATTNVNNQNNAAYQQYITSLEGAQAQAQQSAANAYTGLSGALGGGLMSYYGNQNNSGMFPSDVNSTNPSMQSLYSLRNAGYPTSSSLGPSWNGPSY